MKIDKYFKDAAKKAIRFHGGQVRVSEKFGISRSTISDLVNKKIGATITDETKRKVIPLIKDHFPKDYPIEKWLAEKEGMYLSPGDIKPKLEELKDAENLYLSGDERILLKFYRLMSVGQKTKIIEEMKQTAINELAKIEVSSATAKGES